MHEPKRILMVYPPVPTDTYWSFKHALYFVGKKSAMPPLGLITLAAYLPDECEMRLVDMNLRDLADVDLDWAEVVFISAMIVQKAGFQDVVARCHRRGVPVVAGGPYATAGWREIEGVDHFVLGEVETVVGRFWADFQQGKARHRYAPAERPSLASTRTPRFDLLDLDAYAAMNIQYSRGCPFHCEFCDIWKFFGHRPRVKRAVNLLAELDALYTLGWHGPVFVVDDNFIGNRRRVKQELLPALIDWQQAHGHVFQFNTEATVDLGRDEPLLEAMRRAGFNQVFLGIETPSAAGLREAGKTNNLRTDMLQAVKTIQRHGLEVMAGFIIGFDSDTESIFDRQIDFIQQAGIPKAMVGLLSALPGSALAERLEREGRLTADFNGSNTHRLSVNFIPRMAPQRLIAGYLRVLATIYDSDLSRYFQRCNQMLDTIEHAEFFQRRIGWREVRAVVLSLLRQPFAPYGRQYLRYIARNLRRHPRIFGEVLSYAITGHHLFVITRDILARAARNPLPDTSGPLTVRQLDGAANLPTVSGCAN